MTNTANTANTAQLSYRLQRVLAATDDTPRSASEIGRRIQPLLPWKGRRTSAALYELRRLGLATSTATGHGMSDGGKPIRLWSRSTPVRPGT